MKRFSYFILLFALILFLANIAFLFFSNKEIKEEKLYASVNVTDSAGFDLNGTALIFGNVQKPGSSTRSISLENKHDFPIVICINVIGDIKQLLDFDGIIKLEPGERKTVAFSVMASEDIEKKFYSGNVIFKIYRG